MTRTLEPRPLCVVHFGRSRLVGWFGETFLFPDGYGDLAIWKTGHTEFFLETGSIIELPMTEAGPVGWSYDPKESPDVGIVIQSKDDTND